MVLEINFLRLYVPLIIWVGLGIGLGRILPKAIPFYLGKFLFWVGVPISIVGFLRQAELSASVWLAPVMAWVGVMAGVLLGALWLWSQRWIDRQLLEYEATRSQEGDRPTLWHRTLRRLHFRGLQKQTTQGSFLLASMVGNTGYLGYPVTLALVGPQYFGWAVFYDTVGSMLGAYGLGVALAARFGQQQAKNWRLVRLIFTNPGFASFLFGLAFRSVPLPDLAEQTLRGAAWTMLALSLLLMGMRLSQINSWRYARQASICLSIKMLIVPLIVGSCLVALGLGGAPLLIIVLQMAMPPAFATLVIAEAYDLDRELSVTALAMGSFLLLFTLPLWVGLFANVS